MSRHEEDAFLECDFCGNIYLCCTCKEEDFEVFMLPGETIHSGASPYCPVCKKKLQEQVLISAAGWYIGTQCCCGPYSRESHYYPSKTSAEQALKTGTINYRT